MVTITNILAQADNNLLKELTKMIHRIERIIVPSNSIVFNVLGSKIDSLLLKIKSGFFFIDVKEFIKERNDLLNYDSKAIEPLFRKVNWISFEKELFKVISNGKNTL